MTARGTGPSPHVLTWFEGDDWEVDHPDCPMVEIMDGVQDYDCLLGRMLRYEGMTLAIGEFPPPGTYIAKAWAYQSTDYRTFGEWESGIDLTPVEKAGSAQVTDGEQ